MVVAVLAIVFFSVLTIRNTLVENVKELENVPRGMKARDLFTYPTISAIAWLMSVPS